MMLIGVIWAAFAPLLLVVAVVLAAWLFKRLGVRRRWLWASIGVLAPVLLVFWLDSRSFAAYCRESARAHLTRHAETDGILLTSGTANSFGMRYLHDEGFAWVEMRDIYQRDGWARYERGPDGKIDRQVIPAPTARYEVREEFESAANGISMSTTRVIDRQTGEEMARAALGNFGGGRMAVFFGAYGAKSCPDPRDAAGSESFNTYYHVARLALRPPAPRPKP